MIVLWLVVSACGSKEDSGVDCSTTPTYQSWTEGFLIGKCQSCHHSESSNRHGAPEPVHFDSYQDTLQWKERIEATILEERSMPPNGGITDDERILLQQWLDCGTP